MLFTLTALAGSYCAANVALVIKNTHMVKRNLLYTLGGKKIFTRFPTTTGDIMYKIYEEQTYYGFLRYVPINYGFNFKQKNSYYLQGENNNFIITPHRVKYFNNEIDYEAFCAQINIDPCGYKYDKIQIQYDTISYTNNIMTLCDPNNQNKYFAISNMNENDFKQIMIKTYQLPYRKTIFCAFLILTLMSLFKYLSAMGLFILLNLI